VHPAPDTLHFVPDCIRWYHLVAEKGLTQLDKKEIDTLLKYGAYDLFNEKADEQSQKFCEEDIDQILQKRATLIKTGGTQEEQDSKAAAAASAAGTGAGAGTAQDGTGSSAGAMNGTAAAAAAAAAAGAGKDEPDRKSSKFSKAVFQVSANDVNVRVSVCVCVFVCVCSCVYYAVTRDDDHA